MLAQGYELYRIWCLVSVVWSPGLSLVSLTPSKLRLGANPLVMCGLIPQSGNCKSALLPRYIPMLPRCLKARKPGLIREPCPACSSRRSSYNRTSLGLFAQSSYGSFRTTEFLEICQHRNGFDLRDRRPHVLSHFLRRSGKSIRQSSVTYTKK